SSMGSPHDPNQLLLELARRDGSDVVHLAYSPDFERICSAIKPSPTIDDKHAIWERLLELNATATEGPGEVIATPPPAPVEPKPVPVAAPRPERARPVPDGLLFQVEEPIQEAQPWSPPSEPELSPENAERRTRLLADVANSYLGTREQRVAHILHR